MRLHHSATIHSSPFASNGQLCGVGEAPVVGEAGCASTPAVICNTVLPYTVVPLIASNGQLCGVGEAQVLVALCIYGCMCACSPHTVL